MKRLDLQRELEALVGHSRVYFQPPEGFKLSYPCIVYKLFDVSTQYANNHVYQLHGHYEMSYLHQDPDDGVVELLLRELGAIDYVRQFALNGVYHDVMRVHK